MSRIYAEISTSSLRAVCCWTISICSPMSLSVARVDYRYFGARAGAERRARRLLARWERRSRAQDERTVTIRVGDDDA